VLLLLAASIAQATVPDTMGLGARWAARGGGSVALVDDGTAAFVNPAGLRAAEGGHAAVGLITARPRVAAVPSVWWDTNRDGSVDERDAPLSVDPTPPPVFGLDLHLARPIGRYLAIGATAYLPTASLIRFATFEPALPYYLRWGNRLQRTNLTAGIAVEPLDGLRLGIAADLLAKTRATARLTIDATARGGTGTQAVGGEVVYDVHLIDITVVPAVAPVAGLQLDLGLLAPALDGGALGVRYHGAVGLPLDVVLDGQANVRLDDVGDEPYVTALVAAADFALFDHDVPQRLDLGASWVFADAVALHADARWTDWRGLTLNIARVEQATLEAPLVDLDGAIRDGNEVAYEVRATWGVRGGAEVALPSWAIGGALDEAQLRLRAGASYDPTPLVSQGDSAMLDSDHSMWGGGVGLQTGQPLDEDGAMALDLAVQVHTLAAGSLPRAASTPTAGYPVAATAVPFGGRFAAVSMQWSLMY